MELVLEHENMCQKIQQIVAERIRCSYCDYVLVTDENSIIAIKFIVQLDNYEFTHTHEVHIRELEACIERNNGSVLPIANAIVQAVKIALVNSIFREEETYYDQQRTI